MSDKVQAVRCPYCGALMRVMNPVHIGEPWFDLEKGWNSYMTCDKCGSSSPFIQGCKTKEDAIETCLNVAAKRWRQPSILDSKPVEITHWMPYPDAPKEDEDDE